MLRDPLATPPVSDAAVQRRIAPWSVIRNLLEEALREEDPLACLVEDLRAEESRRER